MTLCMVCLNIGPKKGRCKNCLRQRRIDPKEKNLQEIRESAAVERDKFLSKMHKKLVDFNMETTGSEQVDDAIRDEIGEF